MFLLKKRFIVNLNKTGEMNTVIAAEKRVYRIKSLLKSEPSPLVRKKIDILKSELKIRRRDRQNATRCGLFNFCRVA